MKPARFLQAAAACVFLVLCFSFLAATLMHTAPAARSDNSFAAASPRSKVPLLLVSAAEKQPLDPGEPNALPILLDPAPKAPSVEEEFFFRATNRERATEGLPQLKWDDALAAAARKHAALMADENELSHRLPGEAELSQRAAQAGARFSSVGENVAIGPDAPGIHNGWMHSPGHRANILGAGFNALGVGVVERDGQLYSVEDFSRAVESLSLEQQEKKVAALLSARGLHLSQSRDDAAEARKICEAGSTRASTANSPHPSMEILQYATPDLSDLPEQLERSLRDSRYHEAAVGACTQDAAQGALPRFRVVILLFPQG